MKRANDDHREPKKWDVPGGSVEKGEGVKEGMLRELEEESGIKISKNRLKHMKTLYVQDDGWGTIDLFRVDFKKRPEILMADDEHTDYAWITLKQAKEMDLISGGKWILDTLFPTNESEAKQSLKAKFNLLDKKSATLLAMAFFLPLVLALVAIVLLVLLP